MSDSSVSRCAAPCCEHHWHKMGEGKLFLFHSMSLAGSESRRKVWLCEDCYESWEVTIGKEGQIVLAPLASLAS